jgi:hypothetical protein
VPKLQENVENVQKGKAIYAKVGIPARGPPMSSLQVRGTKLSTTSASSTVILACAKQKFDFLVLTFFGNQIKTSHERF